MRLPFGGRDSPGRLEQVPQVTAAVPEDRYRAVGFRFRIAYEFHAAGSIAFVVAPEVIGVEKERDPAAGLVTDAGLLRGSGCACKQDPTLPGPERGHHDPALVFSRKECVLYEVDPQRVAVEIDRLVVVMHDDGDQSQGLRWGFHGLVATGRVNASTGSSGAGGD